MHAASCELHAFAQRQRGEELTSERYEQLVELKLCGLCPCVAASQPTPPPSPSVHPGPSNLSSPPLKPAASPLPSPPLPFPPFPFYPSAPLDVNKLAAQRRTL